MSKKALVASISVRRATLLILCTSFSLQVLICGMPLEQTVDGGSVYTSLNESTGNASSPEATFHSADLNILTRILAVKLQFSSLRPLSQSDLRRKKAASQAFSDIRSVISALLSRGSKNEDIQTPSYSTTYKSDQTTLIYHVSNERLQGHNPGKEVKDNKTPSAEAGATSTSVPYNSDTKFNRKIEHSSGYKQHSRDKGYSSAQPVLRLSLESDNFTFIYPGDDRGRQFFGSDEICLKDVAFNKKRTWFMLRANYTTGEAYMALSSVLPESQMLNCMVKGQSEDIVYSGWHRWGNETSGTKSLSCETACKSPGIDPFTVTNYQLRVDTSAYLNDSAQRNIKVNQVHCLTPTYSGLYICIAVDSKYNVFFSASQDIHVVNVVTTKDSYITPPSAVINQNETRQTFVARYCTGYFSPRQNTDRYSAQEVDFFYTSDAKHENASFSVSTLHTQKWVMADKFFENLNLTLPAMIRCKFNIQISTYSESQYLELYFRHSGIINKTQSTFTAVQNETFTFSCFEETFDNSKPAMASYSEGSCSNNASVYNSQNSSSFKLRINKETCVKCSSLTSEISLQINVEQDFTTFILKTDGEHLLGACPVLDNFHTEYFSVKNSDVCERNAISLLKGTQQYQNRMASFTHSTYQSFYTYRQFIICRDQPIPGPTVVENQAVNPSQNVVVNIVLLSIMVVVALLLLLATKHKFSAAKLIGEIRNRSKCVLFSRSLKRNSALFIDDIINDMDSVHPRENIERCRISIQDVIDTGHFGKIYKACLKTNVNSNEGNEVTVEEHKWPTSRKDKQAYLRHINQEIQVLRVITPHINIIRYYGFSISPESNLIVREFASGISLLDYLHQQRTRIPDFVFKARHRAMSESRSDITNAICLSVDCEDGVILNNGRHDEIVHGQHTHERPRVCGNVQTEVAINERKDSNTSDGDLSEASDTNHGIWYVNFENDSVHNDENLEYFRETNATVSTRELNNKAANENLVMEMLSIYRQVARGMAHLSYLNIILSELTASDLIVQFREYPLVVKICNFSSAYRLQEGETVYKRGITGSQRVKWLPPEAVKKGEFTVHSDVWSFGMLCWEVCTLGSVSCEEARASTEAGKAYKRAHLPRPPGCDEEIFAVMESCWNINPEDRPSFESLVEKWSDILEANSDYLELRSDVDYNEIQARL